MAGERRPMFELHIRPMFRLIDQVHMARLPAAKRIDLTDYQQVKDSHVEVSEFLQSGSPMPPKAEGGPWPREWIDLFIRWTQTGFGHLAAAAGSNYQLVLMSQDRYLLSCDVQLPDPSATAWIDILQAAPDAQLYQVVMEQIENAAPSAVTLSIDERIRGPLSVAEVVVLDGTGEHRLAVPSV
jgi:hypothetical protein